MRGRYDFGHREAESGAGRTRDSLSRAPDRVIQHLTLAREAISRKKARMKWRLLTTLVLCLVVWSAQFALGQTLIGQTGAPTYNMTAIDIAVNPLTDRIYTTGGVVGVIDGRTRTHASPTIYIDNQFAQSIAVNPITNRIYVPATGIAEPSANVYVFDGRTNLVIDTISFGTFATSEEWSHSRGASIAVNPVTNRVYVAIADGIVVIDGATDQILDTVMLGDSPVSMAVNYRTNRIYAVVNNQDGQLIEIDGHSHHVSEALSVGHLANQVAVDVVHNRVYISATDFTPSAPITAPGFIYVVDGRSNRLIEVIPGFNGPIAVDPLTSRLWAVNNLAAPTSQYPWAIDQTVSLIDIPRNVAISTLDLGSNWIGDDIVSIAVNPVTNEAFTLSSYGLIEVLSGGRPGHAPPIAVHPGHWRNLSPQ
jgi:DNA-binding beta-propeller fold protein YncE